MNYVAANSVSNTLKHTFSSSRGFSPVCLPSFSHPPPTTSTSFSSRAIFYRPALLPYLGPGAAGLAAIKLPHGRQLLAANLRLRCSNTQTQLNCPPSHTAC